MPSQTGLPETLQGESREGLLSNWTNVPADIHVKSCLIGVGDLNSIFV